MKKYFYCYSMNLKKFLMDNGLRYEWVDTNPKSNKLIKTSKRYVTEVSPNGNEVVKCYKFFKVNDYDEWILENKK